MSHSTMYDPKFDAGLWLSSVVDNSGDAILSKTLDGVITSWNAGAEKLFGFSAAEAIGQPITLIIPEDRLHEEAEIIGKLRAGERVDRFETVRRRSDGEPVHIEVTISPVRNAEGEIIGASKIARDIGEDARAGRLYLPLDWLAELGLDPQEFMANPTASPQLRRLTQRLLVEADRLYVRSEAGVPALPLSCRPGIFAARHIYAGIGAQVARRGYDSVAHRARTGRGQKLGWLMLAGLRTSLSPLLPHAATLHARPATEVAFLVDAAVRMRHLV